MNRPVMPTAEQEAIAQRRLAPALPVHHMMGLGEPSPTAGEPAPPVPGLQRPTKLGAHGAHPSAGALDLALGPPVDLHHTAVAGQAAGRLCTHAGTVMQLREAGLPILTPCKCCFGSLKHADHWMAADDLLGRPEAVLTAAGDGGMSTVLIRYGKRYQKPVDR